VLATPPPKHSPDRFRTVGDLKPDLEPIMWKSLGVVLVGLVVALVGLRLLAKFMRMKN
jgi:hypothetical protein